MQALADTGGMRVETDAQIEVYHSLPDSLQKAFASQTLALVELALSLLRDEVGEQELERLLRSCLDAGFWSEAV